MYLELVTDDDVSDAFEQLRAKRQQGKDCIINHIEIHLDPPLRHLSPAVLEHFFDHVRSEFRETPVELHLSSCCSSTDDADASGGRLNGATSTNELARLLSQAPNLQLLEINDLTLFGRGMQCLKQALLSQQQLREVYLSNIQHADSHGNLKPLAEALCSLPHLQSLELCQVQFSQISTFNADSLATIAQHCHTKSLEIMACQHHDPQRQGAAIGEGLLNNKNGRLRKLGLSTKATSHKSVMFDSTAVACIALVLSRGALLQTLELNVCATTTLVPLADALMDNRSLRTITICWELCPVATTWQWGQSNVSMVAFRRVLKDSNFCLEHLEIVMKDAHGVFGRYWADSELDFYLQLNRLERARLLQSPTTPNDWITTLSKCHDDVSSLFYFLSVNPQLCYERLLPTRKATSPQLRITTRGNMSGRKACVCSPKSKRHERNGPTRKRQCIEWSDRG
jgi:hypothetical protein